MNNMRKKNMEGLMIFLKLEIINLEIKKEYTLKMEENSTMKMELIIIHNTVMSS
jgi:hypothetical protein